jgi:hypothetical protein
MTTIVEVNCSFFTQLLSWSEKASRKKRLQTKASRDKDRSQRMQVEVSI